MQTNAEKYLKDGVSVEEFVNEYADYYVDETVKRPVVIRENLRNFLEEQVKPTLTEDERVILRNMQKGLFREGFISRTAGNELFVFIKETGETIELYIFNHLFQFIKERGRI